MNDTSLFIGGPTLNYCHSKGCLEAPTDGTYCPVHSPEVNTGLVELEARREAVDTLRATISDEDLEELQENYLLPYENLRIDNEIKGGL